MVDFRDWIRNVLNRTGDSDDHPLEGLSASDIEVEINDRQTELELIESKIDEVESELITIIEQANRVDGPAANRLKLEAKTLKKQYPEECRDGRV